MSQDSPGTKPLPTTVNVLHFWQVVDNAFQCFVYLMIYRNVGKIWSTNVWYSVKKLLAHMFTEVKLLIYKIRWQYEAGVYQLTNDI